MLGAMLRPMTMVVLFANSAWFGLAFWFFALRARAASRILIPASARSEGAAAALIASLRFLGGMNLGLSVLSASFLLTVLVAAGTSLPGWQVFLASGLAHATQFVCNVPFALVGGRRGGAPWDVLQGPMAFIFVVDAVCMLANAAVVISTFAL